MRIFKNLEEAFNETYRELTHNGVIYQSTSIQDLRTTDDEGFKTKELLGYSFLIKNPLDYKDLIKEKKLSQEWIEKEFEERTSQEKLNPGEAWKLRDVWKKFLHKGKFSYTYSELIGTQIARVTLLLQRQPDSRQGLITIYNQDKHHNMRGGFERVPCSMFYQLVIRENKVNLIYVMRSSDLMTHFLYDIILASKTLEYIAYQLNLKVGSLLFFTSSLHVFMKDNKEAF